MLNDYMLVFFVSILSGIEMGYSLMVVALSATCAMVFKFLADVVELYLDEPDA